MANCCDGKESELALLRHEQGRILKIVLLINAVMFGVEFTMGWVARSSALKADSLDMLGDAIVYGFSLYVLHRGPRWRAGAALLKGLIVTAFGIGVVFDVVLKVLGDTLPEPATMGAVGALALGANLTCLALLVKHRDDDVNMRSTFICSRNDIISNVGVLLAALAVSITQSKWADIGVGLVIAVVFLRSAWQILTESIVELRKTAES